MLVDLFTAVAKAMPKVTHLFGLEHLAASGAPPRVVWVATRDRFDEALRPGGNPPALLDRTAGVDLHAWGVSGDGGDKKANFRATEELVGDLVRALYEVAGGSLEYDGVTWSVKEQGQIFTYGDAAVLQLFYRVPVAGEKLREVTLLKAEQTAEVDDG